MSMTTVSSKYQIVIPLEIRRKIALRPGQKVLVEATDDGNILVKTDSKVSALYGTMRKTLQYADEHVACAREEANHDRSR